MNPELERLFCQQGLVVRKAHPTLWGVIDGAFYRREIERVLPGIYAPVGASSWKHVALAACLSQPDAVVTGKAAAALGFMPRLRVDVVEVFRPSGPGSDPSASWHFRPVPPEWIVIRGSLRFAAPAWSAMELAGDGRSDAIDEVLRCGVSLDDLRRALDGMRRRRGNKLRRQLLHESRDEPWSAAERLAHRLLHEAGVRGWRTNHPVAGFRLDIAFLAEKVGLEIDGYEFHGGQQQFQRDRFRDQVLAANGWLVIRITWAQLQEDWPGVLARLRAALSLRRRQLAA